jgi:hypothetical protein
LHGCVCLVEPERFDNLLQIGVVLADTLTMGHEALVVSTARAEEQAATGMAAD